MSSTRAVPSSESLEARLRAELGGLGSVAVALSGGVDSSVVAVVAAEELGSRALAVTGVSASLNASELDLILALCRRHGLAHLAVNTNELTNPDYIANSPERCYFCKCELFSAIRAVAEQRGVKVIVDGTHAEDLRGHRPGKRVAQRVAADELGIRSPLAELGATKEQVRALARSLEIPNAERPSSPCLSSRIAYGVPVTRERLERVGRAENVLRSLGFQSLRVRLDDHTARIEVPRAELDRTVQAADRIVSELKRLGFIYVTVDLEGFRSGSLLEVLREPPP